MPPDPLSLGMLLHIMIFPSEEKIIPAISVLLRIYELQVGVSFPFHRANEVRIHGVRYKNTAVVRVKTPHQDPFIVASKIGV